MEERVDRRERDDVHQREPMHARLAILGVVAQDEVGEIDLRAGGIAAARIDQIVVAEAEAGLEVVVPVAYAGAERQRGC